VAITALLGALLGAKNSSQSNRTSTSTTAPSYTPEQTELQNTALSTISAGLRDPNAGFAPIEASGIDTINQSYSGLIDAMNRQLASRGFTASGTTGFNTQKILSQRAGDIGSFEGRLAGDKISHQEKLLTEALGAAYKPAATTTTSVAPGNTGAGALSGGLTALIQALNQAMAGGG
jgi:hypothetical protein